MLWGLVLAQPRIPRSARWRSIVAAFLTDNQFAFGMFRRNPPRGNVFTMAETTASHSTSDLPKIGAPATRALAGAGITRLEQLTTLAEDDVLQLHGVGPKLLASSKKRSPAEGYPLFNRSPDSGDDCGEPRGRAADRGARLHA
jgi:hypothetical protein